MMKYLIWRGRKAMAVGLLLSFVLMVMIGSSRDPLFWIETVLKLMVFVFVAAACLSAVWYGFVQWQLFLDRVRGERPDK